MKENINSILSGNLCHHSYGAAAVNFLLPKGMLPKREGVNKMADISLGIMFGPYRFDILLRIDIEYPTPYILVLNQVNVQGRQETKSPDV